MCEMSLPIVNAPPSPNKIEEDTVKMTRNTIFSAILVLKW